MYYQANVPGLVANWMDEDGIDFDVRIKVDARAESENQIHTSVDRLHNLILTSGKWGWMREWLFTCSELRSVLSAHFVLHIVCLNTSTL